MADKSSVLYLNNCSLLTTTTGMRLTTGSVFFDNAIACKSQSAQKLSSLTLTTSAYHGTSANSVAWSPDGKFLAVGGNYGDLDLIIYSWNGSILTPQTSAAFGTQINMLVWGPDGKYLAVGGNAAPDVVIYAWDGATLTSKATITVSGQSRALDWSPDGRFIAVGADHNSPVRDFAMYRWDGHALTVLTTIDYSFPVYGVAWHPDGKYVAVGPDHAGTAPRIYSWNGNTLTQIINGATHETAVYAWSPDGRYLTSNVTSTFRIWRWTGSQLQSVTTDSFSPGARFDAWHPNGRYLAVAADDSTGENQDLTIYEFNGTTLTKIVTADHGTWALSVDWTPDGNYIAVAGNNSTYDVIIYKCNYINETQTQALSNSIVFGNSAQGATNDADVIVLPGAQVKVDGKVLYDGVS